MTEQRLVEIEARLKAALVVAPAPWEWYDPAGWWVAANYDALEYHAEAQAVMANAPTDIRDLLAEVRRLRAAENAGWVSATNTVRLGNLRESIREDGAETG